MRKYLIPIIILACFLLIISCKKDSGPLLQQQQQNGSLEKGLLNLSVNGQLLTSVIDTSQNTILVTVPSSLNQHALTVNFTLQDHVSAALNNAAINSGAVLDLSSTVIFKIANGSHSTSFKLSAQNEWGYFGLPGTIVAQNSLNRDYDFYLDQMDGSTFASVNCGPASTSMAIKWADSTFKGKPVDARNLFLPQGGWWDTGQIQGYLYDNGINNVIDTLSDLTSLVKNTIDNGDVLILNPDMNYIPYNGNLNQHTAKFYQTTPGWGHYFLVKGYKQLANDFYLEVDDPNSNGMRYSLIATGQPEGKDRYYNVNDVKLSTKNWWPYAIIIAPKGQKVIAATHLTVNSLGKTKAIPKGYGR